jgi:acyl-coenzyme A thioesterase PaaI-like protein
MHDIMERGDVLKCSTALINKGKTLACLESEVDNNGILVAKASGSYSIFSPKTHFDYQDDFDF